jgi:hypothetical protein
VSVAREELIRVLEQTGANRSDVRRLVAALRLPNPRPYHLDELEHLIEVVGGPEVAALVVAEAYRGGLGG